jgi:hypothetical protein
MVLNKLRSVGLAALTSGALIAAAAGLSGQAPALRADRPELREVAELHELLVKQFEKSSMQINDAPKGKVVRVDRERDLVYVDLGSADSVLPQVSFSVMPSGSTGKAAAARQRKGAIEVVTVLEPHLSSAKIVEEASRYRDPIMPNDVLFNPAWSPTQKVHVALAGIFDLNGDGIDDTQDLIRMLEKQGSVVDAHLDVKSRQVKGPGITERTEFLILGEQPALPESMLAAEGNSIAEAARDVIGKITEMKAKAKERGVAIVQYRKYLSSVGLRLPKGNPDLGASSYLRGTGSIKPTESAAQQVHSGKASERFARRIWMSVRAAQQLQAGGNPREAVKTLQRVESIIREWQRRLNDEVQRPDHLRDRGAANPRQPQDNSLRSDRADRVGKAQADLEWRVRVLEEKVDRILQALDSVRRPPGSP